MANLLWGFNFAPAKDEKTGKDIDVDVHAFVSVSVYLIDAGYLLSLLIIRD